MPLTRPPAAPYQISLFFHAKEEAPFKIGQAVQSPITDSEHTTFTFLGVGVVNMVRETRSDVAFAQDYEVLIIVYPVNLEA